MVSRLVAKVQGKRCLDDTEDAPNEPDVHRLDKLSVHRTEQYQKWSPWVYGCIGLGVHICYTQSAGKRLL